MRKFFFPPKDRHLRGGRNTNGRPTAKKNPKEKKRRTRTYFAVSIRRICTSHTPEITRDVFFLPKRKIEGNDPRNAMSVDVGENLRHEAFFAIWKALNRDGDTIFSEGSEVKLDAETIRDWYKNPERNGLKTAKTANYWLRITWPLHSETGGLADKLNEDKNLRANLSHEAVRWAAMAIGSNGKKFDWLSRATEPNETLVRGAVRGDTLGAVLEAHPLLDSTKDITGIKSDDADGLTAEKLSYLAQLVAMETFFHKGVQLFDGRPSRFSARTMVGIANGIPREEELGDLTSRLKPSRALMDHFMPGYMQKERRAVRPGASAGERDLGESWLGDFKKNVLPWTINGKDDPSFRDLTGAVHNVIAARFDGKEGESVAELNAQITALTIEREDLRQDLQDTEDDLTACQKESRENKQTLSNLQTDITNFMAQFRKK